MLYQQIHLTLPAWTHDLVDPAATYTSDEEKVALAIDLSRRNVDANSGGPFGAVVFGPDHRVIALGVNRVMPHTCSLAHAETMAYMLAQQRLQTPRLNDVLAPVVLAMCGVSTTLSSAKSAGGTCGSWQNTSSPAAKIWRSRSAVISASSSTMEPRAMLTNTPAGPSAASTSALTKARVSAPPLAHTTKKSTLAARVCASLHQR